LNGERICRTQFWKGPTQGPSLTGLPLGLIWFSGFRREDLNVKVYDVRRTDAKWWQKLTWHLAMWAKKGVVRATSACDSVDNELNCCLDWQNENMCSTKPTNWHKNYRKRKKITSWLVKNDFDKQSFALWNRIGYNWISRNIQFNGWIR
jgi:hypothetical protein